MQKVIPTETEREAFIKWKSMGKSFFFLAFIVIKFLTLRD